jgi:NADH-quinone oxidoreductase subunit G
VLLNANRNWMLATRNRAVAALAAPKWSYRHVGLKHGNWITPTCCCRYARSRKPPVLRELARPRTDFNGTVRPAGRRHVRLTVLRVLGNLLGLQGFDYETSESFPTKPSARQYRPVGQAEQRGATAPTVAPTLRPGQLERRDRRAEYFTDALARRSDRCQRPPTPMRRWSRSRKAVAESIGVVSATRSR